MLSEPFLLLATLLLAGTGLGWLARRLRLPGVTGQILAGVLLGPSVLGLLSPDDVHGLEPLTYFALALIGVTVGAHLNVRRLRNAGRRLVTLLLAEAAIVPTVTVCALLLLTDAPPVLMLLLGPLAISTAPATVVAVVRETRSRGVFVKTLIAAVAMNNLSCILLFEAARSIASVSMVESVTFGVLDAAMMQAILRPIVDVGLSVGIGTLAGVVTHALTSRMAGHQALATVSAVAILLTTGLTQALDVSPLLAAIALGAIQTNLNPARERLADAVFDSFEPAIFCVFFTLAGLELRFDQLGTAGMIAVTFFSARALGKVLAARVAMSLAGATQRIRANLGLALLPQAGVAIGLVILIENDPTFEAIRPLFAAVVLTSVTLAEIFGPVATRIALSNAGEAGMDRPRLIDFLQEENITTDLRAGSMSEAIEKLTDFLISSHHLKGVDRERLVKSALEREAQLPTCIGGGLAVPHGELPDEYPMLGVMGIAREGLHFPTPDGQPVHCVVLLATPRAERDRHLAVLAALARKIGADPVVQQALYTAHTAAHVYQILHDDAVDLNYFIDG